MELAAWLILLLPLISSGLIGIGAFRSKSVSAGFSISAVMGSFILSLAMIANVETLHTSVNWLSIEGLNFDILIRTRYWPVLVLGILLTRSLRCGRVGVEA